MTNKTWLLHSSLLNTDHRSDSRYNELMSTNPLSSSANLLTAHWPGQTGFLIRALSKYRSISGTSVSCSSSRPETAGPSRLSPPFALDNTTTNATKKRYRLLEERWPFADVRTHHVTLTTWGRGYSTCWTKHNKHTKANWPMGYIKKHNKSFEKKCCGVK